MEKTKFNQKIHYYYPKMIDELYLDDSYCKTHQKLISIFLKKIKKIEPFDVWKTFIIIKSYTNFYYNTLATKEKKEKYNTLFFESFSRNGFEREKAFSFLNFNKQSMPFFFWSLKDHVKIIREKNLRKIIHGLPTLSTSDLVNALIYTNILEKNNRLYFSDVKMVINQLLQERNDFSILLELSSTNFQKKKILIDLIFEIELYKREFYSNLEIFWFNEKDICIKKYVLKRLINIKYEKIPYYIINDKNSIIKRLYLEYLMLSPKENQYILEKISRKIIFDKNKTNRNLARFILKSHNINFVDEYKEHMNINLNISILGIGECGSSKDIEFLENFLNHDNSTVKKNVLISICNLDSNYINSCTDKLLSSNKVMANTTFKLLSKNKNYKSLDILNIYYLSKNDDIKKKCIYLLLDKKIWESLINLLKLLDFEKNQEIQKTLLETFQFINEKIRKFYFIKPTAIELNAILEYKKLKKFESLFKNLNLSIY